LSHFNSVNAQEAKMAKDTKPSEDLSTVAGKTMEQARGAMENYLNFFQKSMSASPWAGTELSKKMTDYAQQNVDAAFGFAQKLTQAKDLQDLVRIQTEFFQTQLRSLTEQAKDLSEMATKVAGVTLKGPFTTSS
jgi:phasin family protein